MINKNETARGFILTTLFKSESAEKILLFLILMVTFILGIKQMHPFSSYDEEALMNWIKALDKDAFPALRYPPLFIYLHYILSLIYKAVLSLLGIIDATSGFLSSDFGFRFTLEAGRVVSALFGTLTVYFAYKMGKEFYDKCTGFATALLMCCNYVLILYSHIFKSDILVTLLMTITLYFMLKYLHTPKPVYIFFLSLFFGLAVAAKTNAFPVILVIIPVVLFTAKEGSRKLIRKEFLLLPAGAVTGFFAGAPNWLIDPIGNLKVFFSEFSVAGGIDLTSHDLKSPGETFLEVAGDFIAYFGLIFFFFLIAAVVTGFLTKSKKDILISSFIIVYIGFLGIVGFYAYRFALPIFPAAALLIGKFLFMDLKKLFQRLRRYRDLWQYVLPLLWVPVAVYVLQNTIKDVKSFNLLKTQSLWERTFEFREQHNLLGKRFNTGRQFFSPRVERNDIKIAKEFIVEYKKKDRNKILHFIQAHLSTYESFMKMTAEEKEKKDPHAIRLDLFKPFYRVKKREYQPWDPGCVFLYRISPALLDIKPGQREIEFPRLFYRSTHTSFLPLQIYEKNPNFGRLDNGIYKLWLYSTKEIEKIKIFLFSLQRDFDLTIKINNRATAIKKNYNERAAVEIVELENLRHKRFYYDYVYSIEITPGQEWFKQEPYYFVFYPVYSENADEQGNETGKKPAVLLPTLTGWDIPQLFSDEPVPPPVKSLYTETGVDLSLLAFLNNHHLYKNSHNTVNDISIDFIPLERGQYILRLEGGKVISASPPGATAVVECTFYSGKGIRKKEVVLVGESFPDIPIDSNAPLSFVKIDVKGLRENNYFINRVTITPDYRYFITTQLFRKN